MREICRNYSIILVFSIVFAALSGASGSRAQTPKEDVLRLYWDSELTEVLGFSTTEDDTVTGYIVLENPSSAANMKSFGMSVVGSGSTVLDFSTELGALQIPYTGRYIVNCTTPMSLGDQTILGTVRIASDDASASRIQIFNGYYEVDDSATWVDTQFPYSSTTFCAWLNPGTPEIEFAHETTDFGLHGIGTTTSGYVRVFNRGDGPFFPDPAFISDCEDFSVNWPGNIDVIDINSTKSISLGFRPTTMGPVSCEFFLAPSISEIGRAHV